MSRYIDADALKHRMFNYYDCVSENTGKSNYKGETLMNYEVADMIEDCIDNAPTADVVERKRGEWKKSSHPILGTHFDCSVCKCEWYVDGMRIDDDVNLAFCPNCGADMRKEDEGI